MKHHKPPNNEDWYELRDILIFNQNILLEFDDFSTKEKIIQISKYQP